MVIRTVDPFVWGDIKSFNICKGWGQGPCFVLDVLCEVHKRVSHKDGKLHEGGPDGGYLCLRKVRDYVGVIPACCF